MTSRVRRHGRALHDVRRHRLRTRCKFTPLDCKGVEADGTLRRLRQLFNREDLGGDVVLPGAFRESLATRGAAGIKMLFQHDPNQPIGVWTTLEEDAAGSMRGPPDADVANAREVHALMRAGALDGLSIGFRTVKARRDRAHAACAGSRRSISGRSRSSPFRCCRRRASPP